LAGALPTRLKIRYSSFSFVEHGILYPELPHVLTLAPAKPQRTSVRFRHLGRGRLGMCVAQSALPVSSSLPAVHPVIACEGREVVLLLPLGRVLWLLWGRRMRQQWCGAGRVRRASRDRKYLCFKFVWRLALQNRVVVAAAASRRFRAMP